MLNPPSKRSEAQLSDVSNIELVTEKKSLLKSSAVVGFFTMLSRVLGLVRDVVIAQFLGAAASADAFFVAFKIPNFFRRLFAEGAFNQAFVPVLSDYRQNRAHIEVKALVDRVAGSLGLVLLLFTLTAVLAAPAVAHLFAPGFTKSPDKFALVTELIRITFPYLFLISLTAFSGAILNTYQSFTIPAVTPIFLNISLILAALVAAPYFAEPVFALAWGVMVAGILQLLFQLPFLGQLNLLPSPKVGFKDKGVVRILLLMGPAMFGVSVSQINLLLDTLLASFLPTGSISWLYYADRLAELPLGVFAIAIATVILPKLSRDHFGSTPQAFSLTLDWGLRLVLLIAAPAAAALVVLAEEILTTLFLYGEMDVDDIRMSSYALIAYAFGLIAFMLIKVLAPGFYAREDTKTPMKIGVAAMVANMLFNVLLVWWLHGAYTLGHVGLAAATALSAWLNAGLLWWFLQRRDAYQPSADWWVFLLRLIFAVALMTMVLLGLKSVWYDWFDYSLWERLLRIVAVVMTGGFTYVVALLLVGIRLRHLRMSPIA